MAGDNDKTKKGFSGLLDLASELGKIEFAIENKRPCDLKQLDDYVTNSIGMKLSATHVFGKLGGFGKL